MEIPQQIRMRFLFTFDKIEFVKFYWFEMKNADFYWGSAYKSGRSDETTTKINGKDVIIHVPENFDSILKLPGKYSYHESGQSHYKIHLPNGESSYSETLKWITKDKITKPIRFFTVISKTLDFYNKKTTNPTKGNNYALALNLKEQNLNKRFYFEFFLSPPGQFEIPDVLLKVDKPINDIITHTISPDLILVIRYAEMSNLNEWHPDKELTIIQDDL